MAFTVTFFRSKSRRTAPDLVTTQSRDIGADSRAGVTSSSEVVTALRNAVKLGSSLILTYSIALGVRIFLPRYLGPEVFGRFNWADGFSAAFFVAITLGIDTYIRKEVSVRPEHTSDFYGGTFLLRVVLALSLLGAMAGVMQLSGEPVEVRQLVYLFAASQLFVSSNATLSAVLHARGRVDGLSVLNVVTKVVWGGGLFLALWLRAPLPWLAVPQLAAESVETLILFALARKHLGLVFRVDFAATRKVLSKSLPFYLNATALVANGRLDVTLLGLMASKAEVGWYGGAWGIAGLTMMITPMIGWVVMPLLSRAAARSQEELTRLICRALEATLAFSIPVTLAIGLGADVWIRLMYGPAFAPAALALRILSPMFVFTYTAVVTSVWLMIVNRAWTVTLTSVLGLVLNPLLNLLLVKPFLVTLGPSGGAAGTAISMVLTEAVVTTILVVRMGRKAFDRRNLVMLTKTLGICVFVFAMDRFLLPLGSVRLVCDALAYVGLALVTGAVRLEDLRAVLRLVRNRNKPWSETPPATAAP